MLKLAAADVEVILAPDRGGALLALRIGGRDILRPAPVDTVDPLGMASFPLVPYANRIAHGRFALGERQVQLPLNFGDHPHSLHGVGWTARWTVVEATDDLAMLVHGHEGSADWPWAYDAIQHVQIGPGQVEIGLEVRNAANSAMPVGLGFHPYFIADPATTLRFAADGMWLSSPDMLPEQLVEATRLGDWSDRSHVSGDTLIDNCYVGWDGTATIDSGSGQQITVTATDVDFLHLYRPPGAGFFCVEPVTHMPDAVNRAGSMEMLPPGATRRMTMSISATSA